MTNIAATTASVYLTRGDATEPKIATTEAMKLTVVNKVLRHYASPSAIYVFVCLKFNKDFFNIYKTNTGAMQGKVA